MLTALDGPSQGVRYVVAALPAYLGSGEYMDVAIEGPEVAESHARLSISELGVFIEDLGTGAPTRVNTREVKRAKLQNGDIIEIGEARLLLQLTLTAFVPAASAEPAEKEETREEPKKTARQAPGPCTSVWAAGFSPEFREWFKDDLAKKLKIEAEAFRSGEDVIVALSKALSDDRAPALIILDLRMPIINGINVAIATRAFEHGFNRPERIPIVFMFHPPEQASFEKVMEFCQPLRLILPGRGEEDLKIAARKAIKGSRC